MEENKNENIPQEGEFKMKKKRGRPRKLENEKATARIDLSKKETKIEEDAVSKLQTGDLDEKQPISQVEGVEGEVRELQQPKQESEESVIEEIIQDAQETKEVVEQIKEEVKENPQMELPENVEKLVQFMKETGGNVEDYVRLNRDYSDVDDVALLKEYYKQSKPHLNAEEIEFLLNDEFAYDEEEDDEKTIRKRKLGIKEEVAKAKGFLEDTKSKYYDEIKLRPGVTQDQQKAMDFFNRYNSEQERAKQTREEFINNTNKFFKDEFKGFDFDLGEKKVRYKVNNTEELLNNQSDISNFFEMFLDKDGKVKDYNKYHKSLFAAKNIDTIANHFYEQGRADAVKNVAANSKNIDNKARLSAPDDSIYLNGLKVKAVSGVNSSKLKIKRK
jgi:hypothetical protein